MTADNVAEAVIEMMSIGMSARRTYSGTFDPTFGPWAILFAGTVVVLDEMSGDRVTLLLVPFRPGILSAPFPFDDIQYSGNISEEIRNLGTDLSHALILRWIVAGVTVRGP